MNYGSMFGDGAGRGPDFTALALHEVALKIKQYYDRKGLDSRLSELQTIQDLKNNGFDQTRNVILISAAQQQSYLFLTEYLNEFFAGNNLIDQSHMRPSKYISSLGEIKDLSAFMFWGAWVCSSRRPGYSWSYTHNWPYDPQAGNFATAPTVLWSVFGCLALVFGIGLVLYFRGRLSKELSVKNNIDSDRFSFWDRQSVDNYTPTKTQSATYKFFITAAILFFLQILAGALTIHDFIGLTQFGQIDLSKILPITVVRSWHLQLSLLWISAWWIGSSIFLLPIINRNEPEGQLKLINLLYFLVVIVTIGDLVGIYLGPLGFLGKYWHLLGSQGWEFVELGKLWQVILFGCFALWALIIFRGIRSSLTEKTPLSLPNWLFYSVLSILVLFISGFVSRPETNFVIADFWRWCVIHMWVEAFFEVFTTAIVAYFLYVMGLVSSGSATRSVYLVTLLFLGSGILGISHNFYWNAKPVATLAIGSVFSTLQVVPLILLSLEAWNFKNLPFDTSATSGKSKHDFGQNASFKFLIAVNFWNFFGAGVFGFIINLPIVNYYEHGTYLTVNHGHAALMGVYGNLAIAAMLFCARFLANPSCWSSRLLDCTFWSLNIGLILMVLMDLFPVGVYQLIAVLEHGLYWARSLEFINTIPFQTLTWLRAVGGYLFLLGGVIPLLVFMTGLINKRKSQNTEKGIS
jgi:nitric oxide reductase subunit B